MDEILYQYLSSYYNALSKVGYIKDDTVYKLLIYNFYRDFVMHDYRGSITKEDYQLIESLLDSFYGTNCLMSYPDYLKMGKLCLGDITEIASRVRKLEDTEVVKVIHDEEIVAGAPQGDVLVFAEEDDD